MTDEDFGGVAELAFFLAEAFFLDVAELGEGFLTAYSGTSACNHHWFTTLADIPPGRRPSAE